MENLAIWKGDELLANQQLERLTRSDEKYAKAAQKIVQQADRKIEIRKEPSSCTSKVGHLVLLWQFMVDQ